jgi:hypothetical protein
VTGVMGPVGTPSQGGRLGGPAQEVSATTASSVYTRKVRV